VIWDFVDEPIPQACSRTCAGSSRTWRPGPFASGSRPCSRPPRSTPPLGAWRPPALGQVPRTRSGRPYPWPVV
jgi:hypothetical protein